MPNVIKKHFPSSITRWKLYALIAFPVMFSSLIYSLNGFVDNFMVGSLKGGAAALSAANTWTGIVMAIITGICATGSIFVSQYFNKGDFEHARQVQRLRIVLSLGITIPFALMAILAPNILIKLMLGENTNSSLEYSQILEYGIEYIRLIAFVWLLYSISVPISLSLSETGHGKYVLGISCLGLTMNIVGNYLLLNVFNFGMTGIAISTLMARGTTFIGYQLSVYLLKFGLFINPFSLLKIKKNIWKQYFKRSFFLFFSSFTFVLIEIRVPLFARAYPIGSIGHPGSGVGAMSVFALTFAIMNIFLTSFSGISATAANFVGKELGKNNLKQALINSDELKGFNTTVSIIISLIFFATTFAIPSLGFLAKNEPSKDIILQNVKTTCWVICLLYPIWVLLETSRINSLSGGKVNIQTSIDFIYGFLQLIFLVIMVYFIIPNTTWTLAISFLVFSSFDILLLIAFEICYKKLNWNVNVTEEFAKAEIDVSKDNYKLHISHE